MHIPSRADVDLVGVIGSRIQLTNRGREFVALCPFHDDKNPSFSVVPDKGFAHCFGCGWNGDAIEFLRDHDGVDFKTAVELVSKPHEALPIKAGLGARPKPRLPWTAIKPPPDNPAPASFATRSLGEPVATWCYRDTDGAPLGYDARYEVKNRDGEQKKAVLTWTYGHDTELKENVALQWAPRSFNRPRPLYGLDRLATWPARQAIIVSGCKTADATQQLFPASVAVTWCGGDQNARHTNWTPLSKRDCIVIPDADESGIEAGRHIAAVLHDLGCQVRIITPEPERERGWDLADALAASWTPDMALEWARKLVQPYTPTARVVELKLVDKPAEERVDIPPSFSDDAIADTFARRYKCKIRYVAEWKSWYIWEGVRWRRDETLDVQDYARFICREVVNWERGALLSEAGKRAIASKSAASNVEFLARSARDLVATSAQWDHDRLMLGTPSGMIDLRTGIMRPAVAEDYCTRITCVAPVRGEHPLWDRVIAQATGEDVEKYNYIKRWIGYMLTGDVREECFMFLHGAGGSGKSTLVKTISDILNDYATTVSVEAFLDNKLPRHSQEIAKLAGKRFVSASETEEGRRWNESLIKALTGRDKISAHHMRQNDFEFYPQFKLLIFGNHIPRLKSVGEEMRRRVHLINYGASIEEAKRDPTLKDRITAEYPAILQWMIDGCVDWLQQGLSRPQSVRADTDEYLRGEDVMASWIEDCCRQSPGTITATATLYKSWSDWCVSTGEYPVSQKRFAQLLEAHGYQRARTKIMRGFSGIELIGANYNNWQGQS